MQKNNTDWWDDLENQDPDVYIPAFQRCNQRLKDQRAYELEKQKYHKKGGSSKIARQKDGTDVRSFKYNGKDVNDVKNLC